MHTTRMTARPWVLLSLVSALLPERDCSPRALAGRGRASVRPNQQRTTIQSGAPDAARRAPRAFDASAIEVRIGRRGDGHALPRAGRNWHARPARLVINTPYQSWSDEGSLVHVVAYTPALSRCATADFYLRDVHIGRGDEHGAFAFKLAHDTTSAEVLRVACRSEDDRWHRGELRFHSYRRSREFEKPIVYVYADRGVYRPGQTLRVRALAWRLRGEYVAAPSQRVAIALEGPDGQPVGGARIFTDEDGVGALEIPLPSTLAEGQYKLVATHIASDAPAGTSGGWNQEPSREPHRAEAPIQIRRFETPVIEVQHTLGEFLTPAMRSAPFTVTLGYLDGAPFTNATVAIALGEGANRITLAPRAVRGPGPHAFTLGEAELRRFRDDHALRVEIAVTDGTGRRDVVVRSMQIVDNPYRATLELDRNGYAPGEQVDVALRLTDVNSVIQRAKPVSLRGCGQSLRARTDDTGVAHFRFAMPYAHCEVEAFAIDARGAIAHVSVPLTRVRPMQSRVLEERLREREPVTIDVRFPADIVPVERVVHGDLTDSSGAIIESFSIPIEDSERPPRARAVLRPPSWGSMLVSLYTLGVRASQRNDPSSIGLLTDGQSIAVGAVPHLEVTLRGVDGELRPGSTVPVHIDVRRDGAPVSAALGVSLVDRGVINMLDPFERPPFDRFYDPQQKVLASTGAQTLTWPVVQRTWGHDRYDIGWLPSFGMHEGADNASDPLVSWPDHTGLRVARGASQSSLSAQGAADDALQEGFGTLSANSSASGGGGVSDGTIGLGGWGTIGHGAGTGTGSGYGSGLGSGLRARSISGRPASRLPSPRDVNTALAGVELQNTAGRRVLGDEQPAAPAPRPTLIVRTNVDDTSLWLPRARAGGSPLSVRVPETIGEHQLNVLASDRQGGVALARASLTVRQPIYVRADVPESLTAGDLAEVIVVARNATDQQVELDLSLRASQWTVEPLDPTHVTAPARGQATARFRVRANAPGRARYEVEARGAALVDVLRADTWVRPAGTSTHERRTETLRGAGRFRASVSNTIPGCTARAANGGDCTAIHRVARLSIALPQATAWDAALQYRSFAFAQDVDRLSAKLLAASQWADMTSQTTSREAAESLAAEALFALSSLSAREGDRGSAPSLRAQARLVEALARAKRAGYPMPRRLLNQAISRLETLARRDLSEGDRWLLVRAMIVAKHDEYARYNHDESRDIALDQSPYLGSQALRSALARLERGVGSEPRSFAEALSLVSEFARDSALLPRLSSAVSSQFQAAAYTSSGSSPAGSPPQNTREWATGESAARALAVRSARALLAFSRQVTIEPGSWARTDRVFAAAVGALALHAHAPREAAGELREVSELLRAQRSRWEAWADPEASALALQALALAGTRPERPGAAVIVRVGGRELRRVQIDPSDPWSSALSLGHIELDEALGTSDGEVEVEYTGALDAQVTLDVERWARGAATSESLSVSAPETTRRGAVLSLRVRATRPSDARGAELWVALPPFARLEEDSLDRQVAAGVIASWQHRGAVAILSFPSDTATMNAVVDLRMRRTGTYSLGAVELRSETGVLASVSGPTITVE